MTRDEQLRHIATKVRKIDAERAAASKAGHRMMVNTAVLNLARLATRLADVVLDGGTK